MMNEDDGHKEYIDKILLTAATTMAIVISVLFAIRYLLSIM